jgi:uncharacterized protein (DUF58 family)
LALLEPRLLARLERLQVGTRRRLGGQFAGEHRSIRRGTSVDFADYREYHPGDDFRRIDYQLLARLDVVLLRLFEAEDDLVVRLLVDTSTSMRTGEKLEQARRVAAALGFVALVRRDAVTLHTFPSGLPAPRFTGRAGGPALFSHLEALEADGGTEIVAAATHLLARPGPPGLTVLISDLLTPEWETAITRLPARGGDLVVVHLLAGEELKPELVGDLDLVDVETGRSVSVSLTPTSLREYARLAEAWADGIALRCRRAGAAYVRLLDTDDLEERLLGSWRDAGVLR